MYIMRQSHEYSQPKTRRHVRYGNLFSNLDLFEQEQLSAKNKAVQADYRRYYNAILGEIYEDLRKRSEILETKDIHDKL